MHKARLLFSKTGRAIYLSHLDVMRTFRRAFARADIALKHSQGFNPHPSLAFALPLSVGTASVCELLDFETDDALPDDAAARLNAVMPEGIVISEIYEPTRKFAQIKWLVAAGRLVYDNGADEATVSALIELFDTKPLMVEKKTKRGLSELDLSEQVRDLQIINNGDGILTLTATVSAQNPSVKPELLVAAIERNAPALAPDFAVFRRIEVYDATGQVFR